MFFQRIVLAFQESHFCVISCVRRPTTSLNTARYESDFFERHQSNALDMPIHRRIE